MRCFLSNFLTLLTLLLSITAQARLLEPQVFRDTLYLVNDQSNEIYRYLLAENRAPAPIKLPLGSPQAIHVDDSGIYVSFKKDDRSQILKQSWGTDTWTPHIQPSALIFDIEEYDGDLILAGNSHIEVWDNASRTLKNLYNPRWPRVTSPNIEIKHGISSAIFTTGVTTENSLANLYRIPLLLDDTKTTNYANTHTFGDHAQPFPTRNWVVSTSGNVYSTENLNFVINIGAYIDIDFWQGLPIVLRDGKIYRYNHHLQETGSLPLPKDILFSELVVYKDRVMVIRIDQFNQILFDWQGSINSFENDAPPFDPASQIFKPDEIALDNDQDTVYLFNKELSYILRWSLSQKRYLETIFLDAPPQLFTYSAAHDRIYLSYEDGNITYIDLESDDEKPFFYRPTPYREMVAAGDFLMIHDIYPGYLIRAVEKSGHVASEYTNWMTKKMYWGATSKRIYFLDSYREFLGSGFLGEQGVLEKNKFAPISIEQPLNAYWFGPVRVSEDGKFIAIGEGMIFREGEDSLDLVTDLYPGGNFTDLTWLHGNLFTIDGTPQSTTLTRWRTDFSRDPDAIAKIEGEPVALLPLPEKGELVVVHLKNGKPMFETRSFTEKDFDADGMPDSHDAFPNNDQEYEDTDKDGIGNNADNDDDNDGLIDLQDPEPTVPGSSDVSSSSNFSSRSSIGFSSSSSKASSVSSTGGGSKGGGSTNFFLLMLLACAWCARKKC